MLANHYFCGVELYLELRAQLCSPSGVCPPICKYCFNKKMKLWQSRLFFFRPHWSTLWAGWLQVQLSKQLLFLEKNAFLKRAVCCPALTRMGHLIPSRRRNCSYVNRRKCRCFPCSDGCWDNAALCTMCVLCHVDPADPTGAFFKRSLQHSFRSCADVDVPHSHPPLCLFWCLHVHTCISVLGVKRLETSLPCCLLSNVDLILFSFL